MLHREVKDFYWGYRITPDILELRNLVAVASPDRRLRHAPQ